MAASAKSRDVGIAFSASIAASQQSPMIDCTSADYAVFFTPGGALDLEASPDGSTGWLKVQGVTLAADAATIVNPIPRYIRLSNATAGALTPSVMLRRSIA